jgi:hypothetical protein
MLGSSTYWVESARSTGSGSGVNDWGSASEGDPVGIITIEDVIEEVSAPQLAVPQLAVHPFPR